MGHFSGRDTPLAYVLAVDSAIMAGAGTLRVLSPFALRTSLLWGIWIAARILNSVIH